MGEEKTETPYDAGDDFFFFRWFLLVGPCVVRCTLPQSRRRGRPLEAWKEPSMTSIPFLAPFLSQDPHHFDAGLVPITFAPTRVAVW